MFRTAYGTTNDPAVNNALDLVEGDLKDAVVTAIGRLNAVLDGHPGDTRVLHAHLGDLHNVVAQIDLNTTRRTESRADAS